MQPVNDAVSRPIQINIPVVSPVCGESPETSTGLSGFSTLRRDSPYLIGKYEGILAHMKVRKPKK